MSISYYLRKKVSPTWQDELKSLIDRNDRAAITDYVRQWGLMIHIGTYSGNNQFTFDHNNGEFYPLRRQPIESWTRRPDMEIVNEYGDIVPADEFWTLVDESYKNGMTLDEIIKLPGSAYLAKDSKIRPKNINGTTYAVQYYHIMNDGLKFAENPCF